MNRQNRKTAKRQRSC